MLAVFQNPTIVSASLGSALLYAATLNEAEIGTKSFENGKCGSRYYSRFHRYNRCRFACAIDNWAVSGLTARILKGRQAYINNVWVSSGSSLALFETKWRVRVGVRPRIGGATTVKLNGKPSKDCSDGGWKLKLHKAKS